MEDENAAAASAAVGAEVVARRRLSMSAWVEWKEAMAVWREDW